MKGVFVKSDNLIVLKRRMSRVITALCLLLSLVLLHGQAESSEDPRDKYRKIEKEIKSHKEEIEKTKKREHSVLEEIDNIGRKLDSSEAEMRKLRKQRRKTESDIRKVENDIKTKHADIEKGRMWIKRRLRAMQKSRQDVDVLYMLTETDDIGTLSRRFKYLESITQYERRLIDRYTESLTKLSEKEKKLQELRAELLENEKGIKEAELLLSGEKNEKKTLLASIKKDRSAHEQMLKELEESSKKLLDIIRKLEKEEVYDAKGFARLKGRLGWPVNGRVVTPFGSHKDPVYNIPVFRNGIYIKAENSSVRTVYGGKIAYSDWFKGYGNLMIVNHGQGYHSLYANLSETFFRVGDIIKDRDIIGRVGESGITNAPSLYFEIRFKGKPLDPARWLKNK